MQTAPEEDSLTQHSISLSESTRSQSPGLNSNSPSCEQLSIPPLDKPPPIPTFIAPVDKRISPSQQRSRSLRAPAFIPPADFQIFTDGSFRDRIEDGGAGLVVSRDYLVHEWHAPTRTRSSSFHAENAALKEPIYWLSSFSSWASAIVISDSKSMVQAVSNSNSADSSVIQLKSSAAVLVMSRSILIMWAPSHCGLTGSELAGHQAKLVAAETQPDNAL